MDLYPLDGHSSGGFVRPSKESCAEKQPKKTLWDSYRGHFILGLVSLIDCFAVCGRTAERLCKVSFDMETRRCSCHVSTVGSTVALKTHQYAQTHQ